MRYLKKKYKHLTLEEREKFYALKEQNLPLRAIAIKLNRSHTTLSRELRRNKRFLSPYIPCHAHTYAKRRIQLQRATAALKKTEIYDYVLEKLKLKWSPETIAGRLSIDHPGLSIHFETIYRFIYRDCERGYYLWTFLTHARKRRMKKNGRRVKHQGKIPDAVSIDQRPQEVNDRKIAGHWETDNVEGRKSDRSVLSTTVERVTRYIILSKLKNKTTKAKNEALVQRFRCFPTFLKKSITADNGPENRNHKQLTRVLHILMFFCHAYHSWEKGTNENTNGRLRRYIPKGKSIDDFSEADIAKIEDALNDMPRKCLGFLTPKEALARELKAAGQTLKQPRIKLSYFVNWQENATQWFQSHPL